MKGRLFMSKRDADKRDKPRYAIISPVRDEEQFIEKTIKSVISQTIKPVEWIIVNDGSTDKTKQIVEKYVEKYSWMKLINLPNRGFRKPGGESALQAGLKLINVNDYNFIVRLDGDLSFGSAYFEELFKRFAENPKLGIASGACYYLVGNKLVLEKAPQFHVPGPLKVYRKDCWKDIGGFTTELGWDTVDEIKAQMLAWKTQSFKELKVIHHRRTGTAKGIIRGKINGGKAAYVAGYHPVFMILRAIRQMADKPYLIGGAALAYGFLEGYFQRIPRVKDPELIRYLRRQQINRLIFRKTIWK